MDKQELTAKDIAELENVEIKASASTTSGTQDHCSNGEESCGGTSPQKNCTNTDEGCGDQSEQDYCTNTSKGCGDSPQRDDTCGG